MHAFLIDPVKREVSLLPDINAEDWKAQRALIKADCMTTVSTDDGMPGDMILIDDEGRINGGGERYGGFGWLVDPNASDGYQPLAGYGLLVGCNEAGETVAPAHTLEQIQRRVHWLDGNWFANHPAPPMQFIPMNDGESFEDALKRIRG